MCEAAAAWCCCVVQCTDWDGRLARNSSCCGAFYLRPSFPPSLLPSFPHYPILILSLQP